MAVPNVITPISYPDTDVFTSIVSRNFRVEEVTHGDPKRGFFLRYKGQLLTESTRAYDELAAALAPHDVTPLFRVEDGRSTVLLVQGTIHPTLGKVWVNILLFVLTVVSVLLAGSQFTEFNGPIPTTFTGQLAILFKNIWNGWPFALSLLGILSAHEFGHYFAGKAHGAAVTLPYFIPLPLVSPLGTMGAFIQLKSLPKNKRSLFDLAIAGPLAGLVIAIPVLIYGLATSTVGPVTAGQGSFIEGNSIAYLLSKWIVFGKLLPDPAGLTGLPLLLHWVSFFFIGRPLPVGGTDVIINQVAWAGWVGLLVTFLNLIPAGQFDGGHIIYSVFGRRVNAVVPFILVITVLLGFLWSGWWLWAFLIFLLGRAHAEPLDQITKLDAPRKALAALMLFVFLMVLTPIPFILP
jgi:membrane-associated protease RseP (regulator of RpoE activity)